MAGLDVEADKDGISAWNVLQGNSGERPSVPIVSASRHAYITKDHALVGGGSDYQLLVENQVQSFKLFDIQSDVSQTKASLAFPEAEQGAKVALTKHLKDTQRGYFNWDVKYAHTTERWKNRVGDHAYDIVVNDLPEVEVHGKGVDVSPIAKELMYTLQGTTDGNTWYDMAEYFAKEDAASYTFTGLRSRPGTKNYRVQTVQRFGLPSFEHFGTPETGELDAFLPQVDTKGDVTVENGQLTLRSGDFDASSRTRYFVIPHSRGKIYASAELQFEGSEPECRGELNWLRQNGWVSSTTAEPVSLRIYNNGIFLENNDTVRRIPTTRLSDYDGSPLTVLFEFEFGTTANDSVKVYLNPGTNLPKPAAHFEGEFTFDRLQFAAAGRSGATFKVDNVRIGTRLKDVLNQK